MEEVEAGPSPMMALTAYADAETHDPGLWRRVLQGAASLDPEVAGPLLLQARSVTGAPKGEIDTVIRIARDAYRKRRKHAEAAKKAGGSVVRMDGSPVEQGEAADHRIWSISDALAHIGYPHDGNLPIPAPYRLGTAGDNVRLMVDRGEDGQELLVQIAPAAIFLAAKSAIRHRNGANVATYLTLVWRREGRVKSATIPSEVLADRNRFGRLRALDLPIPVRHASSVAEWLSACEETAHAAGALPVLTAVKGMGWVGPDPGDGFFHGVDLIGARRPAVQVPPPKARAAYEAHGLGGTWEGWVEKVWRVAERHPRVMLAIYASVSAALAGPLDADPFLFEYGARTSKGKSKALALAASVWGKPKGTRQIVAKWGSTHIGTMRRGADQSGIPLILDDTKEILTQQGGAEELAKRVYALINAGGRMKADKDDPEGWEIDEAPRIVVMTGGETPIADISQKHPGAIARIMTIRDQPWDVDGDEGARIADQAEADASMHYGHAGRRVVEWLTAQGPETWDRIRDRFQTAKSGRRKGPSQAGASMRGAAHVALVEVAAAVAAKAWGLPVCQAAIDEATRAAAVQVSAANVPLHAYHALWAHLATRPHQIQTSDMSAEHPTAGYIGRRMPTGHGHFAVPLQEAEKAVRAAGYDYRDSLGDWIGMGWAKKQTVRIAGTPVKCLVLARDVAEDGDV
jgi:hypothetical protein